MSTSTYPRLPLLLVGILVGMTLMAQELPTISITVQAGQQARWNTPVFTEIPAPVSATAYQLYEITNGKRTAKAFQVEANRINWILDGATPAGTSRTFELVGETVEAKAENISVKKGKGAVTIQIGGQPVLQYAYEPAPLPEGVNSIYERSGFIHPLWSPEGQVLTRIQPPDHWHHYGIWNPWTRTQFEGRKVDYWNLYEGQGTVRSKSVMSLNKGSVFGGFTALLEHVDLTAPDPSGAKVTLNETWDVKAWNADPQRKVWLVDFTSTLSNPTDSLFKIEAYRYQGFGFRATEKWDDNTASLLTSEGKNKTNGNATRARWCDVRGVSDATAGKSGIVFMTHPGNYNFPEQLRIWPTGTNNGKENVFFNFNPAQEQDWDLQPGQTYQLNYRMLVYDGAISTEEAERYWYDFAHPPKVEVTVHPSLKGKKVLVYTKNGEGYVHDNIPNSIAAIKKLGSEHGFAVDASDDPAVMTDENLKQYDALIFSNTNNQTFATEAQKLAFQKYIQAGGGFVALHSASGSERQWDWFAHLLGGRFKRHPEFQEFDIKVLDKNHPSTAFLPDVWTWSDECYYLTHLNPQNHVLLAADMTTVDDDKKAEYPGSTFGDNFPLCWSKELYGGRQWYTALGHSKEFYENPVFLQHIMGGIQWVLEGSKPLSDSRNINTFLEK